MTKFIGININWKRDLKVALIASFILVTLTSLIPQFSIAVPLLPQSSVSTNFIISGIVAPIAEEVGFRVVVLNLLTGFITSFALIAITSALIFSLAHYFAYTGGGLYTTIGDNIISFISAFVFGIAMAYVVKRYDSVLPAIIIHSVFNVIILSRVLLTISGV
jgi:membrane protease YdiL (CAAX protease family)